MAVDNEYEAVPTMAQESRYAYYNNYGNRKMFRTLLFHDIQMRL